jgi:PAS domain S-box-containing protein
MYPAQILIADDHEAIRKGIRQVLSGNPDWHVCGEAANGEEAVAKAKSLRPDIILMDIAMPRMNGLTAARTILHANPGVKVIIVSQRERELVAASGINAAGFVDKSRLAHDLEKTIRAVMDGDSARDAQDGNPPATSDSDRDAATLRHEAERKNGLLAAIVDSSEDAIVSKNLDGTITSWNKGAERLFGYRADETVGKSIRLVIPADRQQEEDEILHRIRHGQRVDHFETIRQRKDGALIDVSVTISPVRDESGRIVGASKVARDIGERKVVERRLRESEQQLRTLAEDLEATVRARTSELEKRNAEMLAQSEQLRRLSRRLQRSQDAERRRVARDLHDSAGQIVALLSMNLERIRGRLSNDAETLQLLQDNERLVEELSREIRTVSYLLHPPLLDESGLEGALSWYSRGLSERGALEVELVVDKRFARPSAPIELALFRVVQECLTNIHRHSGSKTAKITLSCDDNVVMIGVEDYGKGIPEETLSAIKNHRAGVGITAMHERIREFGGTLSIDSGPRGTKVSVQVPSANACTDDD